jgi:hypothetical protein
MGYEVVENGKKKNVWAKNGRITAVVIDALTSWGYTLGPAVSRGKLGIHVTTNFYYSKRRGVLLPFLLVF